MGVGEGEGEEDSARGEEAEAGEGDGAEIVGDLMVEVEVGVLLIE